MPKTESYDASKIKALKGLEPVKKRPGMYTRTDSPTHMIQEVLDNGADEAQGGFADTVTVKMHKDGSTTVIDNGRGIPVDIHPEEGVSAAQVIFTVLHSGGKFDNEEGGAYQFSGGLHGVGVSVTNALSTRLEVRIKKNGYNHFLAFENGDVVEPLKRLDKCEADESGTEVRSWPDPQYFDSPHVDRKAFQKMLKSKAVLLNGVTFKYQEELDDGGWSETVWKFDNGMEEYLADAVPEEHRISPIITGESFIEDSESEFNKGEGAAWALVWAEGQATTTESFVNLIPTPLGGTQVNGLRSGVVDAVRLFAEQHGLMPRGVKLSPEDVFGQVNYVVAAKISDPQFQGQTKDKLTSRSAVKLIQKLSGAKFEHWLHSHVDEGKEIAGLAIRAAEKRMRASKKVEKSAGSGAGVLPGKLTDCSSRDLAEREVFIVEGDSAGGSAKTGRDRERQAILPIRGKILNSWETAKEELFLNKEIHDISVAIGVDPHSQEDEDVDLSGLRYSRICILADADVDGAHIQTLLLSLFTKHFYQLVKKGHIWISVPPLYRIDASATRSLKRQKFYVQDDAEKASALSRLQDEGYPDDKINIQRFKGLGEMPPETLWETTLNPESRIMLPILPDEGMEMETEALMDDLLSKKTPHKRREMLEIYGNEAEVD